MPLFCLWITAIIKIEFNLKICGVWIHFWHSQVICTIQPCNAVLGSRHLVKANSPSELSEVISNAQRWDCQNSQIICFPKKKGKYPKVLKLQLPQTLLPHITSTFGKVPLTLAAYLNMAEQFLSNFSNELGTNRHVSLGTHAIFSVSSFSLKINNFSKLPCKKSHNKQYVRVYYWLVFGMWNYLARCFANATELGSDQRPVSQMHLSFLTLILITELS